MHDPFEFISLLDNITYPKNIQFQEDKKDFTIKQLDDFGKPFKTKVACIELYPECINHLEAVKHIIEMGIISGLRYAMILHDHDMLSIDVPEEERYLHSYDGIHKKPHIHVVIKFRSQRYNTGVARELNISSNYVKMFKDKLFGNRIAYLLHCDNYDKYQYPVEYIYGTLENEIPDILNEYALQPYDMFRIVCSYISKYPEDKYISRTRLQEYMCNFGYSSLLRTAFYRLLCERVDDHNYSVKKLEESSNND